MIISAQKTFYTEVLGLQILKETYRAERASYKLDLALNEQYIIELFSFPNPPKRLSFPEATGLRHLAFSVKNLNQEIIRLKHKGVQVEAVRKDPITEKNYVFFADPDGLPIELYEVQ